MKNSPVFTFLSISLDDDTISKPTVNKFESRCFGAFQIAYLTGHRLYRDCYCISFYLTAFLFAVLQSHSSELVAGVASIFLQFKGKQTESTDNRKRNQNTYHDVFDVSMAILCRQET